MMFLQVLPQSVSGLFCVFKVDGMSCLIFRPVIIVVAFLPSGSKFVKGTLFKSFLKTMFIPEDLFDSSVDDLIKGISFIEIELPMFGEHKSPVDHVI